ncbi:hypothetical protein GCM10025857_08930 [Alicyclobacillus contaminans]|uniref:hypothetical protein n=1 Tax=Alicyclobacillus contaminans TaxID=392016 RepID=UPI000429924E|nr:hypothetical protein [Alicyclobacillus contaminans]GMA49536.1 hypothetical protein GCM10025857_08930 [Alicyclobacillus contaminans]
MELTEEFEVYTLQREDLLRWPDVLRTLRQRMEQSEIKVVDVRRERSGLTLVFRRLQS